MVMKPETVQAVRAFQTGFALMKTVLKMWSISGQLLYLRAAWSWKEVLNSLFRKSMGRTKMNYQSCRLSSILHSIKECKSFICQEFQSHFLQVLHFKIGSISFSPKVPWNVHRVISYPRKIPVYSLIDHVAQRVIHYLLVLLRHIHSIKY